MVDIDSKIADFQSKLEKVRADLAKDTQMIDQSWVTNLSYQLSRDKLITVSTANIADLKLLLSDLKLAVTSDAEVSEILNVEPDVKFKGYTYDDWVKDCRKRVAIINLNSKKSRVAKMEQALEQIMSPEAKRLKVLDELTNDFDSL